MRFGFYAASGFCADKWDGGGPIIQEQDILDANADLCVCPVLFDRIVRIAAGVEALIAVQGFAFRP